MAIDKMKLFESARDRWPPSFRITPTDGAPCFEAEPELVAVYDRIEKACEPTEQRTQNDEWTQLANWAFHQALWALAKETAAPSVIRREDVTFDLFDQWVRLNLSDESWEEERREYEESPSRFH
jgi:DNA-binding GntR family transcriptional regulator